MQNLQVSSQFFNTPGVNGLFMAKRVPNHLKKAKQ